MRWSSPWLHHHDGPAKRGEIPQFGVVSLMDIFFFLKSSEIEQQQSADYNHIPRSVTHTHTYESATHSFERCFEGQETSSFDDFSYRIIFVPTRTTATVDYLWWSGTGRRKYSGIEAKFPAPFWAYVNRLMKHYNFFHSNIMFVRQFYTLPIGRSIVEIRHWLGATRYR